MKLSIILVFLLLVCLCAGSAAQASVLQPVDPKRESPRATLDTFFEAFQKPRVGVTPDPLEETIKCLDLHDVPPEYRSVKGLEISAQLREVINAVGNFNIDDAPSDQNGEPFVILQAPQGEIAIAKQPSGEWLFSKDTVRSVPLLVSVIQEEKLQHGTAVLTQSDSLGAQLRNMMPAMLKQKTLMLERWQWLGLLVLAVLGFIFWQVFKIIARFIIGKILNRRGEYLTQGQIKNLASPMGLLAFVFIFRVGLSALALTQDSLGFLRTTTFLLSALALTWLAYRVVDIIGARLRQKARETNLKADDLLVPFITTIVRIVIVIIAAVWVAGNLRFDVTGIIAGLGIGGIAIALASQETLSNFFGSLVLLIERPFTADDRVEIGDVKGTIQEVGLRSTRILTSDNSTITVPNSSIAKANIINQGVKVSPRWSIKLLIPYQNGAVKVESFCDGIKEIIIASENLVSEEFQIHLFDVHPTALELRVQITFKVDKYDFEVKARHEFIMDLLRLADKLEIQLEVPN